MLIGKVIPGGYGFPKTVPVVVVTLGGTATPVLLLSFAVGGLAVVLTGNPLELIEEEFGTFAALVSMLKLLMPLLLAD
jgi:hypothetical protein